ncbi:MAG: two-component system response regulator [Desulfuromonas sp.]|nr:MAG: two-component system response regulator [Desulfuromonas sp.]
MSEAIIRLMIVEDDLRISELHRRFVEKTEGFEVVGVANTIAGASEMVELLAPDLILLDLFFPEGSGMELLRELRAGEQHVDVILITAAREVSALQEALHGGVFDYLVKPVYFDRFQEALAKYRDYHGRMQDGGTLEQQEIDRLLQSRSSEEAPTRGLPKGIDPLTLNKVRQVFEDTDVTDLNAEEVGGQIGVSRITARRYLEFLITEGFLAADLLYGAVGRPERRYFKRS